LGCDFGSPGDELGAPDRELFRRGYRLICGLDEAGRGPLAGPVVAAAVVLPPEAAARLPGLGDSKRLSHRARGILVPRILEVALSVAVAVVGPEEIDRINILQASLLAMTHAVAGLSRSPDFLLVDGNQRVSLPIPQETLVKGDSRAACIAAASNLAKEHRDALMKEYGARYPGYGFEDHMGYPTQSHRRALERLGPCPIHRKTFGGVRELLGRPFQPDLFPPREARY
jgi:ribonuclease HII